MEVKREFLQSAEEKLPFSIAGLQAVQKEVGLEANFVAMKVAT